MNGDAGSGKNMRVQELLRAQRARLDPPHLNASPLEFFKEAPDTFDPPVPRVAKADGEIGTVETGGKIEYTP